MQITIRELIKKYAVFGMGGLLIFVFDLVATVVFTEQFNIRHTTSFAIAILISVFLSYLYHSRITFREMKKRQKIIFFPYYFLSAGIFWSISTMLSTEIHYTLAISAAAIPVSMMNFAVNTKYTFIK